MPRVFQYWTRDSTVWAEDWELQPHHVQLELGPGELDLGLHQVPGTHPGSLHLPDLLGGGVVDLDESPLHHGPVESGQGVTGVLPAGHGDEAEALATSAVVDDLSLQDGPDPAEELHQVVFPDRRQGEAGVLETD